MNDWVGRLDRHIMVETAPTDLASVFRRLQFLVLQASGIDAFLQRLSELAAESAADQPMSCGITTRRDGQPLTVASSDSRAEALDESQYTVEQGPCLHTLDTGKPQLIDDLEADTRWPQYRTRALQLGLRCSFSLPLRSGEATVGAMNLYGFDQPGLFTGSVRHRCELFAAQASGAVQISLARVADHQTLNQLEEALASRTTIDQAIGILIGQQRCTADEAFTLLRMRSQSSQRKLLDVAADLITRVTGQPPQPGKLFDRAQEPLTSSE